MSNHRITIEETSGQYRATCSCREASSFFVQRWEADDWRIKHLMVVERVRIHLSHGREPSLRSQRDYFRSKANDSLVSPHDRLLWRQLADELDQRLNDAPHETEPGLW